MSRTTKNVTEAVSEAIATLIKQGNIMGNDQDIASAVVEELSNEHRTLQQNFFRNVIAPVIRAYAENHATDRFDLRNQDACECASKMNEVLEEWGGFRHV
jgi:hypothetical protein